VTCVIPAFNAAATVAEAVGALRDGLIAPDEIIVVDDGSRDGTPEVAREAGARVVGLSHGGPGSARSAGVEAASSVPDGALGILVFTDADCVAEPTFVTNLIAPLVGGTAVAAKGAYSTQQRSLVARFIQVEFEERYRLLARRATVDFVDGHAAAYLRETFRASGGFDPLLRLSQNVELGFRLAEAGLPIRFVPTARTNHRHPESLAAYARAKSGRAYWRARSFRRHPGKAVADSYTPWSLKVQMAAITGGALASIAGMGAELATVAAAAFAASGWPLVRLAWKLDRPVVVVVMPLLLARAAALVAGTAAGLASAVVDSARLPLARAVSRA
jgi:glycosyltransferase involved in cell wall biosynthesis